MSRSEPEVLTMSAAGDADVLSTATGLVTVSPFRSAASVVFDETVSTAMRAAAVKCIIVCSFESECLPIASSLEHKISFGGGEFCRNRLNSLMRLYVQPVRSTRRSDPDFAVGCQMRYL